MRLCCLVCLKLKRGLFSLTLWVRKNACAICKGKIYYDDERCCVSCKCDDVYGVIRDVILMKYFKVVPQ